jgi:hypothetical protein
MALTTQGIAIQILSSIGAYKQHGLRCTTNDCKVVINHLIRKYSEPLSREASVNRRVSIAVANGTDDDTVEDHAVPVIVLVEKLLESSEERLSVNDKNLQRVQDFLSQSLLLVEITRDEDRLLSEKGFQRRMPAGWSCHGDQLFGDPLARYRAAEIDILNECDLSN